MIHLFFSILTFLSSFFYTPVQGATILSVPQGGTGASTLSGCLSGNGTGAITGNGSACGSGGSGFSTTSANFWSTAGLGFSTTSSDYWKTVRDFNSTTSQAYFASLGLSFSTTSANYAFNVSLAGTTSVKSITTLPTLSLPYSQITGTPTIAGYSFTPISFSTLPASATSSVLYPAGLFTGTSTVGTLTASSSLTIGALSGVLKATSGLVSTASNGTDYTLITALTCSAGQFYNAATAAGVFTCGTPTDVQFSTTSASYFSSLGLAFSTTSSNAWSLAGLGFSTTSANFWGTTGLGFSTTSSNFWGSAGLGFSTTSANYWKSLGLAFSTTSSDYWETQQSKRFDFTPLTNYVVNASATTTPLWAKNGFFASTTAYLDILNIATTTATSTIKSPLYLDASPTNLSNFLNMTASRVYPASVTTGGMMLLNNGTTNTGPALVIHSNSGQTTGRLLVINDENTGSTQDMIIASSSGANVTALNVKGAPTGKGVLKIEHTGGGTGFSNGSAISVDLLNATDAQGIFIKGSVGGTGKLINLVDSTSATLANFDSLGNSTTTNTAYAGISSSTSLFGALLSSCNSASNALTWSAGKFGCNTIASAAFSFPFTQTTFGSTNANATGTLIGFTAGLYATASSTIGGGTSLTGLTISGNATTTGMQYVAGTLQVGTTTISVSNPGKVVIDAGTASSEEGLTVQGNVNDFFESNVLNKNTGTAAQACQTATADSGTLTTGFISLCANSSTFWNPQTYNVGGPGDTSFMALNTNDLFIAQGTSGKKTHFLNGGVSTSTNEYMTVSGTSVGVGTTSPFAQFSIGTRLGATGSLNTLFAIASSSLTATTTLFSIENRGQLVVTNNASSSLSITGVISPGIEQSFFYATSTAWTGTTTITLEEVILPKSYKGIMCVTDIGTLNVSAYSTSTISGTLLFGQLLSASTTNNFNSLVQNNSFPYRATIKVDIGTPASSPTKINCTVLKTLTPQ